MNMDSCDKCASLDGAPTAVAYREDLTLVGVGACSGVVAIEHYRCNCCGVVLSRQLMGSSRERTWTAIYHSAELAR